MSDRGSSPAADDFAEGTIAASGARSARSADSAPRARPAEDLSGRPEHDLVDEAGQDSFPSSDPPSWSQAVAL